MLRCSGFLHKIGEQYREPPVVTRDVTTLFNQLRDLFDELRVMISIGRPSWELCVSSCLALAAALRSVLLSFTYQAAISPFPARSRWSPASTALAVGLGRDRSGSPWRETPVSSDTAEVADGSSDLLAF